MIAYVFVVFTNVELSFFVPAGRKQPKKPKQTQRMQLGKVSTVNQSRARTQPESTHVDFPRGMAQFINKGNGKMVCKLIY